MVCLIYNLYVLNNWCIICIIALTLYMLNVWLRWQSACLQCKRPGFDPWVGKNPWRKKWQPTPVVLPGKSHGRRNLIGYSPWGHKESDTTERLRLAYWRGWTEMVYVTVMGISLKLVMLNTVTWFLAIFISLLLFSFFFFLSLTLFVNVLLCMKLISSVTCFACLSLFLSFIFYFWVFFLANI